MFTWAAHADVRETEAYFHLSEFISISWKNWFGTEQALWLHD